METITKDIERKLQVINIEIDKDNIDRIRNSSHIENFLGSTPISQINK